MEGIGNLMLMLASAMQEDELHNELHKACYEYSQDKSEQNKQTVMFYCILLMSKQATNKRGVNEVMKDFEKYDFARKLLQKQKSPESN